MRDVILGAGEEVVQAENVITIFQQAFAQMRADETGSTGDKDAGQNGVVFHNFFLLHKMSVHNDTTAKSYQAVHPQVCVASMMVLVCQPIGQHYLHSCLLNSLILTYSKNSSKARMDIFIRAICGRSSIYTILIPKKHCVYLLCVDDVTTLIHKLYDWISF